MFSLTLAAALAATQPAASDVDARVARILSQTPLVDGHNDLPYALAGDAGGSVEGIDAGTPYMTDLERMREGRVGAQMWSVYIPASTTGDEAIRTTIEQLDTVDRMVRAYPQDLAWARTADEVVAQFRDGRIASMAGVEGGHQIGGKLAALRQFKRLGAIYMTLTHSRTTGWADSATDAPKHGGLSDFGRTVIGEMNRVGMLVDLSHVSAEAMHDVLDMTKAPVIFSHSNARALATHPRNVPDAVLERLSDNGGVVMVTFVPTFLADEIWQFNAGRTAFEAGLEATNPGSPETVEAAMKIFDENHERPAATIAMVADHIEHIAKVAGHDHVGIGGDLDGISQTVEGLDSVDDYPALFAELVRRGWSDENLAKLAGGNVLRVMRAAEAVATDLAAAPAALDKPDMAD
ncbi:dipeptidase [Sphingomicrobium aestuariivivum]|uniref:dipeptidase n=1 Tax=Sphingomicrobium aestuariivivum TaxID=1582356 RepID=UPI001FD71D55|nr:dipeptidase [Sphingomicrobium aestuariivivum]MCJ8191447.1 dipeptidase [Sphingomicrobium aestuariivivum]